MDEEQRPLAVRLLEVIAAGMGIDQGFSELHVSYEDGRVRSWGTQDPKNSPLELHRFDELVQAELAGIVGAM